jgi:hypothetical protein
MKPTTTTYPSDLTTITSLVARSPIMVAAPAQAIARLPAGFDQVDVAILRWISLESRRAALARH